ncbi:MAG: PD-(D/E)XK nuclease family protein [Candidatus Krumholzibacteriota bacterium]|nr:PD-(D/E)XK nuclease family protein [Candidatus Krumholzibacteriota bacterium]
MAFRNRFGYSLSRESTLDACPRRYLFHYYVSWGGWTAGAPAIAREAFKLKRLVSLPLWRGQLVHYVATMVLRSMRLKHRIPARGDVVRYALERFAAQLDFSGDRRYLTAPKKRGGKLDIDWLALFEHEYELPLPPGRIERARHECVASVEGLLDSPILAELLETDAGTWRIEDLDRAEFSQSFVFGEVTVFAKTDLCYRGRDGVFNIVDWKTGGGGSARTGVQLGIYAYWATEVLGEPIDAIRLREVTLASGGKIRDHFVDAERLETFHEHIERGIARLADLVVDGDTERNEARPPSDFPRIDDAAACRACNFYRICRDPGSSLRLPGT